MSLKPFQATFFCCLWTVIISIVPLFVHYTKWYYYTSLSLSLLNVAAALVCVYSAQHRRQRHLMLPFMVTSCLILANVLTTLYILNYVDTRVRLSKIFISCTILVWLMSVPCLYPSLIGFYRSIGKRREKQDGRLSGVVHDGGILRVLRGIPNQLATIKEGNEDCHEVSLKSEGEPSSLNSDLNVKRRSSDKSVTFEDKEDFINVNPKAPETS